VCVCVCVCVVHNNRKQATTTTAFTTMDVQKLKRNKKKRKKIKPARIVKRDDLSKVYPNRIRLHKALLITDSKWMVVGMFNI